MKIFPHPLCAVPKRHMMCIFELYKLICATQFKRSVTFIPLALVFFFILE